MYYIITLVGALDKAHAGRRCARKKKMKKTKTREKKLAWSMLEDISFQDLLSKKEKIKKEKKKKSSPEDVRGHLRVGALDEADADAVSAR
jgi:hypothetical protein